MIKADIETMLDSRVGTRNIASARSNGNRGSTMYTMKYGESPVVFRVMMHSA